MDAGSPTNVDGGTAIFIVQLLIGIPVAFFFFKLFGNSSHEEK